MKLLYTLLMLSLPTMIMAEPQRIEVYPQTQAYIDVIAGDTLGEIAQRLWPGMPKHQRRLQHEIVELNPQAFIDGDPNRLKKNVRLWLPGYANALQQRRSRNPTQRQEFSWGSIKRTR